MSKIPVALLLLLLAVCFGLPLNDAQNKAVYITKSVNIRDGNGYRFMYSTSDGTSRVEKGEFVSGIWTVVGSVSTLESDGKLRTLYYAADDKGYRTKVLTAEPGADPQLYAAFRIAEGPGGEDDDYEGDRIGAVSTTKPGTDPQHHAAFRIAEGPGEEEDDYEGDRIGFGAASSLIG